MSIYRLTFLFFILLSPPLRAQTVLPLWPGTPPNAIRNNTLRERVWRNNILRISQINIPTITIYLPYPKRVPASASA